MKKPTYKELTTALAEAVHIVCDWKPDFLQPDEAQAFDDRLNKIENVLKEAQQ